MRTAACALVVMALAAPVRAQPQAQPQPLAVEIGQVGIIEPENTGEAGQPPIGNNLVGSSPARWKRFIHIGSDVDAKFCMLFGFEFRAPNMPPPLAMRVTVQLDHPLWRRPDGRTGTREEYPNLLSNHWSYAGYGLDEDWTLVPGTWRFTVRLGDMVLATQSFELTVAPGQVLRPDSCAPPTA